MRFVFALPIVLAGLIGVAPVPAMADAVLAVGMPDGDPDNGWVFGFASGPDGAKVAMRYCRGLEKENNDIPPNASEAQKACKVVATFNNKCWAVSSNGSHTVVASGMGWAVEADADTARIKAIAKCMVMAGKRRPDECNVRYKGCDGTAK